MSRLQTFTPFVQGEKETDNPLRAYMQISHEEKVRFDALPRREGVEPIEIFDEVSQRSYWVRPAACGGNCFCAAEIVRKGDIIKPHY